MCLPVDAQKTVAVAEGSEPCSKKELSSQAHRDEIQFRTFRDSDTKECRDLFVKGRLSVLPDYYNVIVFRSTESRVFYAAMCLALIYLPFCLVALMVAGWFTAWYVFSKRVFVRYVKTQLEEELSDIQGTFLKKGSTFMVATMGGGVVGMVGGRCHETMSDSLFVVRMYVDPRAQRRGIAGGLMSRLELFTKEAGYKSMTLNCTVAQTAAQALYLKGGFQIYDIRRSGLGLIGADVCYFKKELCKE